MSHVMDAQLDAAAGMMLRRDLRQMGVHLHLNTTATAILGDSQVTGVRLRDGSLIECDLVVVAAGIRANVDLAVRAGLDVERGIVVGDDLACRVQGRPCPDIYAIGECAQHAGVVYGLVAPVWEQAQVLSGRLTGRTPDTRYRGTSTSTKLKVAGVQLAVMGDKDPVEEDDEVVSYSEPSRGIYKKLILRNNRLAGAIVMGDGAIVPGLIQAFREGAPLSDSRIQLLFPAIGGGDTGAANARTRSRRPRRSATATRSARRRLSKPSFAARAPCKASATRPTRAPAAARAGRRCR